jgi:hypothetical protein
MTIGLGTLIFAGAIFMEGRIATSRVWVMTGLVWLTLGLPSIVPERWRYVSIFLRVATFLCGGIGLWFATQL